MSNANTTLSGRKLDLHTHYYPTIYFEKIRDLPSEFSFDKSPSGQTIIKYRGARFFGVTPPMTDVAKRLEDMDRVGIDVEVISLSTPNVFFTDAEHQPEIARLVNDAYAELIARYPARFKGFASIPMDNPDAALNELYRAIGELKLNGVILLSNIGGKPWTSPEYRPFFAEANRMKLCILLHPMLPANTEPFREYVLGPIIGFMFRNHLGVDFAGTNTARERCDLPPLYIGDVCTVDFYLDVPTLYASAFSFSISILSAPRWSESFTTFVRSNDGISRSR